MRMESAVREPCLGEGRLLEGHHVHAHMAGIDGARCATYVVCIKGPAIYVGIVEWLCAVRVFSGLSNSRKICIMCIEKINMYK